MCKQISRLILYSPQAALIPLCMEKSNFFDDISKILVFYYTLLHFINEKLIIALKEKTKIEKFYIFEVSSWWI
jgi:hypothetical protein